MTITSRSCTTCQSIGPRRSIDGSPCQDPWHGNIAAAESPNVDGLLASLSTSALGVA